MTSTIIRFSGVSKTFPAPAGPVHAVRDVSLDIERGEVFGVIGYSGAGKSTLVRLVNALERADAGTIEVDGASVRDLPERELRRLRTDIGMIFQQFNLFAARTVAANVEYPLRLAGWEPVRRRQRVAELLDYVQIADKARAYPAQLSGGQKQRVGIARALATEPSVLLADEATSALDPETTRDVLDLLRRVNRELGVTIVLITHEMSVVQHVCDRVAVMEQGRVVELGRTADVFADPRHAATRRFVQAALHDRPDADAVARLRKRHPGRLVVVGVRDGVGLDLGGVLAGLDARARLVHGGLTEAGHRTFGSVTLELTGPQADAVLARLTETQRVTDLGTADDPRPDPRWQDEVAAEGEAGARAGLGAGTDTPEEGR